MTMVSGAHSIVYSTNAEADRAFFRDVLKLPHVDVGDGWLIFGLPPAEVAVHPSEENDVHEFRTPAISAWLRTTRETYGGIWAFQDPSTLADTTNVGAWYDGVLFVNESTPTHPTAHARKTVERKESF